MTERRGEREQVQQGGDEEDRRVELPVDDRPSGVLRPSLKSMDELEQEEREEQVILSSPFRVLHSSHIMHEKCTSKRAQIGKSRLKWW